MARPVLSVEERLWRRVNKKGRIMRPGLGHCWEYVGSVSPNGYCRIKREDRTPVSVHRLSWEIHDGPIPDDLLVCHKCDNKICVRRSHLFLGTVKDNSQDMLRKGRGNKARGAAHGNAHLTEKKVLRLLHLAKTKQKTQKQLSVIYGIHEMTVSRIVRGERWAHLQG